MILYPFLSSDGSTNMLSICVSLDTWTILTNGGAPSYSIFNNKSLTYPCHSLNFFIYACMMFITLKFRLLNIFLLIDPKKEFSVILPSSNFFYSLFQLFNPQHSRTSTLSHELILSLIQKHCHLCLTIYLHKSFTTEDVRVYEYFSCNSTLTSCWQILVFLAILFYFIVL